MYKSYIQNKKDYLKLRDINEQNGGSLGGAKARPKELSTIFSGENMLASKSGNFEGTMPISCPITTYMLTRGMFSSFDDVKLAELIPSIGKITKIGSFDVQDKVVIGDTDYNPIDLAPGTYTAYTLADSLMIINDKLKIVPKANDVKEWKWTHSGVGVGVDGGVFGFYDLHTIEFINNKMNYSKGDDNYNNLPYIKCDNIFKGDVHATVVDGSCIHDLLGEKKIDKEIKELDPFGVIADTITGDGGFECFVIDNMRAILLGGRANQALFNEEDKTDEENDEENDE